MKSNLHDFSRFRIEQHARPPPALLRPACSETAANNKRCSTSGAEIICENFFLLTR